MIPMRRRELLKQGGAACLMAASGLSSSCSKPASRADVLRNLAIAVGRTDVERVVEESSALSKTVVSLCAQPSDASVEQARRSWRKCLLAWKHAFAFRTGPVVESSALLRAAFWPPRVKELEALLADANRPLDERAVEALGVDVKGLYAVEFLLFGSGAGKDESVALLLSPGADRRKRLLAALAANVSAYAGKAAEAMKDGKEFAERLAARGQQAVNELVNQMLLTVEQVASERYGFVLGLATSHTLRPREVEGWPSGTSHQVAQELLIATEGIYLGKGDLGLTALVRAVAPAVDASVRAKFADALAKARAIQLPLERIATEQPARLQAAAQAAKALELALKVELASALGVSITFAAGDGD